MKKYLFGTLCLLGAMAVQTSATQITDKIDANGNGKLTVPVTVTGRVIEPADKSLVIEILSPETSTESGFAIEMPDVIVKDATKPSVSKDAKFRVQILNNGIPEELDESLKVTLLRGAEESKDFVHNVEMNNYTGKPNPDATEFVELRYTLTEELSVDKKDYNGNIMVTTNPTSTSGTYTDTSVQLKVEVSGQK